MSADANLQQVTPFYHVADLDGSVAFFVEKLGFKAYIHTRDYAYVHREGVGFRLMLRGDVQDARASGAQAATAERRHAYVDVRDVDALYAEFRGALTDELRNNPDGPRNQTYGQREFTVFGPENLVLFFGQAIAEARRGS